MPPLAICSSRVCKGRVQLQDWVKGVPIPTPSTCPDCGAPNDFAVLRMWISFAWTVSRCRQMPGLPPGPSFILREAAWCALRRRGSGAKSEEQT